MYLIKFYLQKLCKISNLPSQKNQKNIFLLKKANFLYFKSSIYINIYNKVKNQLNIKIFKFSWTKYNFSTLIFSLIYVIALFT